MNNNLNKTILCIGTSKCIGDSLGPFVGENLYNRINKSNVYIFGNIKNNITYQNLDTILSRIKSNIDNPYFILIDSALSSKENIGKIVISKNKMIIGNALNKQNYKLGNLSIKGIVAEYKKNCINNYNELNNVSIDLIQTMSKRISNKIIKLLNY